MGCVLSVCRRTVPQERFDTDQRTSNGGKNKHVRERFAPLGRAAQCAIHEYIEGVVHVRERTRDDYRMGFATWLVRTYSPHPGRCEYQMLTRQFTRDELWGRATAIYHAIADEDVIKARMSQDLQPTKWTRPSSERIAMMEYAESHVLGDLKASTECFTDTSKCWMCEAFLRRGGL